MFCRNCGKELTETSEACPNCGAKPMVGTSFCPRCGAPTTPQTETCANCGARLGKTIQRKTWKSRTAGILAIVAGAVGVIEWVAVAVLEILAGNLSGLGGFFLALAAIAIAIRIVAVVGGIFALKRKTWGLALAGSICAVFSSFLILLTVPLGIAAIVLVVLGRGEFQSGPESCKSSESDLKGL
jgi:hypothetical protein